MATMQNLDRVKAQKWLEDVSNSSVLSMSPLLPFRALIVAPQGTRPAHLLTQFHAASATLSATQWCNNFFTEDITLQFGNFPPVSGLSSIRDDFFAPQLARLDLMEHYIEYFDVAGPRIYQSTRIRYRVKGDSTGGEKDVELPGFLVADIRREGGVAGKLLCYNMEVYVDTRPLEARMAEVFGGGESKSA